MLCITCIEFVWKFTRLSEVVWGLLETATADTFCSSSSSPPPQVSSNLTWPQEFSLKWRTEQLKSKFQQRSWSMRVDEFKRKRLQESLSWFGRLFLDIKPFWGHDLKDPHPILYHQNSSGLRLGLLRLEKHQINLWVAAATWWKVHPILLFLLLPLETTMSQIFGSWDISKGSRFSDKARWLLSKY